MVQPRALAHEVAHVRYVHAHPEPVLAELLDRYGVIEVLGVLRVDGECEQVGKVLAPRHFRGGNGIRNLLDLALDVTRKVKRQVVFSHYTGKVLAGSQLSSQHFRDAPSGLLIGLAPGVDPHDDKVAGFGF